ncbi:hypothetical protein F0357_21545 [Rhizobiales bacterium Sp-1]|uniref:Transcription factor LuxR-like autoinducer-binding domain-containing protein n=1 Tax=Segnochrobactrum spirostomi TaxID=2608987 RepID=A0A6A7Y8Y8_9HYPH|nr:hypothetical protein [Segnochrobactrum spirostomi]
MLRGGGAVSAILSADFMGFAEHSNQCMSLVDLKEIFDKSLRDLGFDAYVFSLVRSRYDYDGHFVLNRYPEEWSRHYRKYDYMKFDPVYRMA